MKPPAVQLALAILKARDSLPRELAQLITPEIAWTLAVLLFSWRPDGVGGEVDLSRFDDVLGAFDRYQDTLLRLRRAAGEAKTAIDIAGTSGLFVSAVRTIGATLLGYLLRSDRFRALQTYIEQARPMPADVRGSDGGIGEPSRPTRSERYRSFDYRPRSRVEPPSEPTPAQLAHWRDQLARDDLSPEMRWFYEQKLESAGQPIYTDVDQAERRWSAVLGRNELTPELRQYFAANLSDLQRLRTQA